MRRLPRWVRTALLGAVACALAASAAAAATGSRPPLPSKDPFYTYHHPLKHIAPGTVLKKRQVTIMDKGHAAPVSAEQLLYRTTGELGQPAITVTTVIRPKASPPTTKIVSYQTAYDALGPKCDPSYTLRGGKGGGSTAEDEEQLILGYVAEDYTVVVSDYEGVQLHWVAGQESGYGTLDGVRATEHFLHVSEAKTPVALVGYSGGSIATDFGGELARHYAPRLDLVGEAEGGVPVDLAHNLFYVNGSQDWSGVIPAVLLSLGRAFNVNINRYLSPYGKKVIRQEEGGCINSFLGRYPGLTYQKMLKPGDKRIFSIEAFVRIVNHLIMSRTGTPKGPVLIGVGKESGQKGDGVMVAADDEALAHVYCKRGLSVHFDEFPGLDHTDAAVPFEAAAQTFVNRRLTGLPVTSMCSSIGKGDSIAPIKRQHR